MDSSSQEHHDFRAIHGGGGGKNKIALDYHENGAQLEKEIAR